MSDDRYTELFAWVIQDPTGEHGIIACSIDGYTAQAVSSRRDLIERLRPLANKTAKELGHPVQLVHYKLSDILETVT